MSPQKMDIQGRLITIIVCLAIIYMGAFVIYQTQRFGKELERLAASGVDAVANVTAKSIDWSQHDRSYYCKVAFTFTTRSGSLQAGEDQLSTSPTFWFHVPPPGEKIFAEYLEVGDEILVEYLPDDPTIHRTIVDCTAGCLDPGAFGDKIIYSIGGFLILIGAAFLYRIRRQLFAPL